MGTPPRDNCMAEFVQYRRGHEQAKRTAEDLEIRDPCCHSARKHGEDSSGQPNEPWGDIYAKAHGAHGPSASLVLASEVCPYRRVGSRRFVR